MDLSGFLQEWNNDAATLTVHTSGSTGTPKSIEVEKERMRASARTTCDFLNLQPGDRALLCLPLDFIAGKMMVVRTLERGLELVSVEPGNHPFASLPDDGETFALAAMVPSQVYCSLLEPREKRLMSRCRNIIIGGGAVPAEMEKSLSSFPGAVWSSYGMTETLSHIALRRLNGPERSDWYTPLDGVAVSLADDGCLKVFAPAVCPTELKTNDLAELDADRRRFRILGRIDNVICCGGVKLQIEEIEAQLAPTMSLPFCVSKCPDPKFGEVAVLLVQGDARTVGPDARRDIDGAIKKLDRYHRPKRIVFISEIPLTKNGKIDRVKAASITSPSA